MKVSGFFHIHGNIYIYMYDTIMLAEIKANAEIIIYILVRKVSTYIVAKEQTKSLKSDVGQKKISSSLPSC